MITPNLDIECIRQRGDTCGLYALAMIIQAKNKGLKGDDIAINILNCAWVNKITKIGEVFSNSALAELANKIRFEGDEEPIFEAEVISFDDEMDFACKVKKAYSEGKYAIIGHFTKNLNVVPVNGYVHWGIVINCDDNEMMFVHGNKECSFNVDINLMYESNTNLPCEYNWKKYFSLSMNKIFLRLSSLKRHRVEKIIKSSSFYKDLRMNIGYVETIQMKNQFVAVNYVHRGSLKKQVAVSLIQND